MRVMCVSRQLMPLENAQEKTCPRRGNLTRPLNSQISPTTSRALQLLVHHIIVLVLVPAAHLLDSYVTRPIPRATAHEGSLVAKRDRNRQPRNAKPSHAAAGRAVPGGDLQRLRGLRGARQVEFGDGVLGGDGGVLATAAGEGAAAGALRCAVLTAALDAQLALRAWFCQERRLVQFTIRIRGREVPCVQG
ncbi:hypothetical protein B0T24DRAFT_600589 [Lasiosphaeria ovina]|uniref:Uncharacterized protein n=1 Tax=Lasiosphaeria ovina TaxID=92902 RepID=A0AAE0TWL5_9PEZI|nr:hypothetical protein B0T24DRAFT_600589 [Lasiosphaeria ovina]